MTTLHVISTSPERYIFRRTYNQNIEIPACPNDMAFTFLRIDDAVDYKVFYPDYDYKTAERTPIPIPARQIWSDLNHAEELESKGCFVIESEHPAPNKEQLAEARARRRAYLARLVQEGDAEMARSRRVDEIPGAMKRAAFELGVERDWAFAAPPAVMECEACGNEVKSLRSGKFPILCKHCGYPLPGQREQAIADGLWSPKGTPPKPKPEPEPEPPGEPVPPQKAASRR